MICGKRVIASVQDLGKCSTSKAIPYAILCFPKCSKWLETKRSNTAAGLSTTRTFLIDSWDVRLDDQWNISYFP